ncbi:MAG TPA: transketolase, partial [Kiloniellaceae bacterium]|nr:transketolase [Kiloniellaceae bacterium]
KRFESSGWATSSVDGHDPEAIAAALSAAQASDRPSLIACKTTIGYGAPNKQGTAATHGSPLGEDEVAGARKELGWPHAAFELPEPVLSAWRAAGARGAEAVAAWRQRLEAAPADRRQTFERQMAGKLPEGWKEAVAAFKAEVVAEAPSVASRVSSQKTLDVLTAAIPELVGGSADLTGSNNTKTKAQGVVSADDFSGSYLHYGVREHGMAAAMNGIALHGGLIPYGGTFLVFTDYCRPSMRLSALMKQRVIYVMTHDSIGLGEDGPTHQPVEHLAALRAIPNLLVFRPADIVETAECWELAVEAEETPSVLALTRQGLPTLRRDSSENHSAYGAYIMVPADSERQVTLLASGSEVQIAVEAQKMLREEGISAAVVSVPCWELFEQQPPHYRDEVLGPGTLHIAIEAASPFGWERWIESGGGFVGMRSFGASAPAKDLFNHFNITAEAVVEAVKTRF